MELVKTTADLAEACKRLAKHDVITVDTEFMRESTFWPKLCLVQMAAPGVEVLVDAPAPGLDLAPFFALMANDKVLKVFHAARQDVEIVHHLGGVIPHPIFDTQVAAMVCGYGDAVSYDALVKKTTGEDIDKSHRFTDWSRRPLSDKQLAYALGDVTHLLQVYAVLAARLKANGRAHWMDEEMAILTAPSTYTQHPEDSWRRLKMKVRKPRQLAVMMEVAAWREQEAQRRDLPRGRVIKDDAIYEIAAHPPVDGDALSQLRSVSQGFARSEQGRGLVAAVKRGLERDLNTLPRIERREPLPSGIGPVMDLLKVLLKKVCDDEGVAQRIVATVDDLEQIAADDNADIATLRGWRRELFGETALALKHGKIALAVSDDRVTIIDGPNAARRKASA